MKKQVFNTEENKMLILDYIKRNPNYCISCISKKTIKSLGVTLKIVNSLEKEQQIITVITRPHGKGQWHRVSRIPTALSPITKKQKFIVPLYNLKTKKSVQRRKTIISLIKNSQGFPFERIKENLGISYSHAHALVAELIKEELIEVKMKQERGKGQWKKYLYYKEEQHAS